ncbi:hypothetical protein [Rothia terrae]|uniref:Uncharacterized protein n=1 Tax=Rothia terrae TaxID=396015 RepID=A0A7H2BFH0_9MICC|nr:hypothetical protein [Rothia terrae]QNV38416.1 hypothetical protein IDM49_03870 [Rothia terrae]
MVEINTMQIAQSIKKSGIKQFSKERDPELEHAFFTVDSEQNYIPTQLIQNPLGLDPESSDKSTINYFFVARGATGKTAFAKYLSNHLQAPLWMTSEDWTINGHSLKLHLIDFTNEKNFQEFFSKNENPLIIVDALDEAMVEISPQTWIDFKKGIKRMSENGLKYIFLGRENALFDLMKDFQDENIPYKSFIIENFNETQIKQFIDSKYSLVNHNTLVTSEHYTQARDQLIDNIKIEGLSAEDQKNFLGYAPVLEAISTELSNSDNLSSYVNELNENSISKRAERIDKIVENILNREQKKFISALDPELRSDNYFRVKEQIQCLLAEMNLASPAPVPADIPIDKQKNYQDQRAVQIQDHPFLNVNHSGEWASYIFEAYCFIKGFKFVSEMKKMHHRASHNPVFYLLSIGILDKDDIYDHWMVSALHNSFIALKYDDRAETPASYSTTAFDRNIIEITESIEKGYFTYSSINPYEKKSEDYQPFSIKFMSSSENELILYSEPKNIRINTRSSKVIFRPESASPELGPEFFCFCKSIFIESQEIKIPALYGKPLQTAIATEQIVSPLPVLFGYTQSNPYSNPAIIKIKNSDEEEKSDINWNLGYPWNDFIVRIPTFDSYSPRVFYVISALDALSKQYKESGLSRSGFCAYCHLDKKNEKSSKVIKELETRSIISTSGDKITYTDIDENYPLFETPVSTSKSIGFNSLAESKRKNWASLLNDITEILKDN